MTTAVARDSETMRAAGATGPTSYSRRGAARIAGGSYLAMFVLAIFANFVVREGMIEPGNPTATVANITESMGLFRLGLVAFVAIFVLDVVIAWALHMVFREVNRDVSLVAAWFRIVYTVLLGVALISFFDVLHLLGGSGFLGTLSTDQINTQVMLSLASFESTWLIGLIAFGLHLVLLGGLIIRSGLMSRILGYTLVVAGVAYVADTMARGLLTDYAAVEGLFLALVAVPSMIGEGWIGLWLFLARRIPD